ncbi:undecaprenyldiphospho-muramoylpentapeptide beta-N-acetylglucosaminyltransferase [Corallincola spongiicola]|uniref:UDP-N-acetylglucosamine--N-acetylmuramyl-(pentapeptide) pyrophosphoryl-undecaprenol N-acetylglucosamine transferase n=1 Tax=Corallincola spongiicola TaxID=2520508 RepID=A0ABY1WNX1_9GAMM|nr:undecaprenyldiphospho-muramoylpentapeptide beta-N-acetylglucosaminyltransferase [Corallincola spongiicola]TAA45135.1 undecaprenyldiphospho-muramoylpentapeptide beta-N-acetylglucosaminyltransferase [Corallincola spongiicola]
MASRLLIMAGGTGGHVFPALAVADYLAARGWQISWLGTRGRLEEQLVPKYGYAIDYIDVQGVRGNGLVRLLAAPFKIGKAIYQARRVIKQRQPDVVLGMGGYASGPGGIAAWLTGKKLVVHEQNAAAGMTNRLLARFASDLLVAFNGAFPGIEQVVGNPVRAAFAELASPRERKADITKRPVQIVVVGGSLGARVLNEVVPAAVVNLDRPLVIKHQTGKGQHAEVLERYRAAAQAQVEVSEFIDDMVATYGWADLVICRAGALTVSEIAMAGVASIFVPLPHAVDDHQTKNAQYLVAAKAAILMPQKEFDAVSLNEQLTALLDKPEVLVEMGESAKSAATPNATADVANIISERARRH